MKWAGTVTCAAVVAVSGCTGAGMAAYTPVEQKTKLPEDSLFEAARRAVEEAGHHPVLTEAESFTLNTREKEVAVSSIPRLSYKYSFHVETKGGVLRIVANCTENSAAAESRYEDCGEDRPQRVIDEQERIRERTLALAKTVESNATDWKSFENPPADDEDEEEEAPVKPGKAAAKTKSGKAPQGEATASSSASAKGSTGAK